MSSPKEFRHSQWEAILLSAASDVVESFYNATLINLHGYPQLKTVKVHLKMFFVHDSTGNVSVIYPGEFQKTSPTSLEALHYEIPHESPNYYSTQEELKKFFLGVVTSFINSISNERRLQPKDDHATFNMNLIACMFKLSTGEIIIQPPMGIGVVHSASWLDDHKRNILLSRHSEQFTFEGDNFKKYRSSASSSFTPPLEVNAPSLETNSMNRALLDANSALESLSSLSIHSETPCQSPLQFEFESISSVESENRSPSAVQSVSQLQRLSYQHFFGASNAQQASQFPGLSSNDTRVGLQTTPILPMTSCDEHVALQQSSEVLQSALPEISSPCDAEAASPLSHTEHVEFQSVSTESLPPFHAAFQPMNLSYLQSSQQIQIFPPYSSDVRLLSTTRFFSSKAPDSCVTIQTSSPDSCGPQSHLTAQPLSCSITVAPQSSASSMCLSSSGIQSSSAATTTSQTSQATSSVSQPSLEIFIEEQEARDEIQSPLNTGEPLTLPESSTDETDSQSPELVILSSSNSPHSDL